MGTSTINNVNQKEDITKTKERFYNLIEEEINLFFQLSIDKDNLEIKKRIVEVKMEKSQACKKILSIDEDIRKQVRDMMQYK